MNIATRPADLRPGMFIYSPFDGISLITEIIRDDSRKCPQRISRVNNHETVHPLAYTIHNTGVGPIHTCGCITFQVCADQAAAAESHMSRLVNDWNGDVVREGIDSSPIHCCSV